MNLVNDGQQLVPRGLRDDTSVAFEKFSFRFMEFLPKCPVWLHDLRNVDNTVWPLSTNDTPELLSLSSSVALTICSDLLGITDTASR